MSVKLQLLEVWTVKFQLGDIDMFEWRPDSNESGNSMMVDEDYMDLMSDTLLFSSITQPFPFPNPREIGIIYVPTSTGYSFLFN
jgi:hypothetical protein